MLTDAQRDRIDVVLVSPRNPLNIGAVARAMVNFGFAHLTVVAPYEPHWREARSAVGAPDVLHHASETTSLAEAVAECAFVIGTGTLTHRKAEQAVISLPDVSATLAQPIARGCRTAIVFGPEKHGLTRDDLSYCHVLVEIPTDPRQPSMNLGQAVAVSLYELARTAGADSAPAKTEAVASLPPLPQKTTESQRRAAPQRGPSDLSAHAPAASATSSALDRLGELIEETMTAAGYSPRAMQPANRHDLRLLLRRLAPSARDTRRMLGLFRRILYRLHDAANRHPPSR